MEEKLRIAKKCVLFYPLNFRTEHIACHGTVEGLFARFSETRRRETTQEHILLSEWHISELNEDIRRRAYAM